MNDKQQPFAPVICLGNETGECKEIYYGIENNVLEWLNIVIISLRLAKLHMASI